MPTVLALERYPVDGTRVGHFERLLSGLVSSARGQPGILWADAARAADDDPSYLVCTEWRTAADLDAWETTQVVAAFRRDSDGLLRGEVTHRRFAST